MKRNPTGHKSIEGRPASSQPPPRACLAGALPSLERALALSEQRLRQQCFASSEVHMAPLLAQLREEAVRLYSLALAWPDEASVSALALSAALLCKNLSFEGLSHVSRTIYQELRKEDREAFEQLRALQTRLSVLRLTESGTPSADVQQRIEDLRAESDALWAVLARSSPLLHSMREQPPPTELPSRVAAALPRDGALVEFAAFKYLPPAPGLASASSERPAGQPRYLALLLLADGRTYTIDLGAAALPEAAALLLHRSLTSRSAHWQAAAQALHALVFRPLLSRLGTARRLFVAPDGWLALTPFTELHDGEKFLSDTFDITQLSSGRDLLTAKGRSPTRPVLCLTSLDLGMQPE
jgi:hypothetical protein